jgi:hypothetical protein
MYSAPSLCKLLVRHLDAAPRELVYLVYPLSAATRSVFSAPQRPGTAA